MEGIWKAYVDENLLPRLHGFEIMMASYAMAHLKLDLTLTETGYKNENQERLGIYLTNSLEEEHEDAGTLFASFLSNESNQASYIKKNMPIMTIIGNPPYSGTSMNN
jgi:predicted helicase